MLNKKDKDTCFAVLVGSLFPFAILAIMGALALLAPQAQPDVEAPEGSRATGNQSTEPHSTCRPPSGAGFF